jgi:alkylation response protein AidB-like acyl-CoA dehydrogenase
MPAPSYRGAEELEAFLGDPGSTRSVVSFAEAARLDEREEFPQAFHDALASWGAHHHYIPEELGGRQRSLEETLAIARAVSRRDLTLAIAHGKTYLGLVPVWGAGTPEQRRHLAAIAAADVPVSLGLTERAHGSDPGATSSPPRPRRCLAREGFLLRARSG